MTTTLLVLVLVFAAAAVVLFGIFAGIPLWMIHRHPDTTPGHTLPGYLRGDWDNLAQEDPLGAGQRAGR